MLQHPPTPGAISTDRAPVSPRVRNKLGPAGRHTTKRPAHHRIEADHGRGPARSRPRRGLTRLRSVAMVAARPAFVHNLRRGHNKLATQAAARDRGAVAFTELTRAV